MWEDRLILFTAYLVDAKLKSTAIKTYISAIRGVLVEDGFELDHNNFTISSLTRACRIRNDQLIIRLPIHKDLLRLLLKELGKWAEEKNQPYLEALYAALLVSGYYGLLRIGEMTYSPHCLLANNVHVGMNKAKLLYILTSSKTHSEGEKPHLIKITKTQVNPGIPLVTNCTCPYMLIKRYISMRPPISHDLEQFFIFGDASPVFPTHLGVMLRTG